LTTFLVVTLKTHAKAADHSHPPNLPRRAKNPKKWLLLCLGVHFCLGCTYNLYL